VGFFSNGKNGLRFFFAEGNSFGYTGSTRRPCSTAKNNKLRFFIIRMILKNGIAPIIFPPRPRENLQIT
jgi:hypothetical protein